MVTTHAARAQHHAGRGAHGQWSLWAPTHSWEMGLKAWQVWAHGCRQTGQEDPASPVGGGGGGGSPACCLTSEVSGSAVASGIPASHVPTARSTLSLPSTIATHRRRVPTHTLTHAHATVASVAAAAELIAAVVHRDVWRGTDVERRGEQEGADVARRVHGRSADEAEAALLQVVRAQPPVRRCDQPVVHKVPAADGKASDQAKSVRLAVGAKAARGLQLDALRGVVWAQNGNVDVLIAPLAAGARLVAVKGHLDREQLALPVRLESRRRVGVEELLEAQLLAGRARLIKVWAAVLGPINVQGLSPRLDAEHIEQQHRTRGLAALEGAGVAPHHVEPATRPRRTVDGRPVQLDAAAIGPARPVMRHVREAQAADLLVHLREVDFV
eukprot:CAMPEP_0181214066 /NCGR_PEP_ID=MMETSP1096-20121128/25249_1 /TAXON_ID=156174 ORGANISM="Chrysochromulina ericina, Strain CCMP281" /NCGR_SAMPLE_ID=MMETSP1096 /ASSEMBLY_ACC=CAM_ASM_000453 /LENGTH=384 /DNA_ID=CAMNT_0023305765 /DNA_START=165 /DNA_END=1318 /DNA_ORIENTATION=+